MKSAMLCTVLAACFIARQLEACGMSRLRRDVELKAASEVNIFDSKFKLKANQLRPTFESQANNAEDFGHKCEIPKVDTSSGASFVWVTPICVAGNFYVLHQGAPRLYPIERDEGEEDFGVSCVAEGTPGVPIVTWKKNGYAITAAESNMYQVYFET